MYMYAHAFMCICSHAVPVACQFLFVILCTPAIYNCTMSFQKLVFTFHTQPVVCDCCIEMVWA